MKKQILISMYALHIGGAERSLIGLLNSIDYEKYDVDLFLYRQEGEFLSFIPAEVHLLPAIKPYTTLERPVKDIIKEGYFYLGAARIAAKVKTKIRNRGEDKEKGTYKQLQYTWQYSISALPKLEKSYHAAISFLGPHDFILDKVIAGKKVGWVHTDYFTIVNPDKKLDEQMWNRLDAVVNVSEACKESFLKVFPGLRSKAAVIENIVSPVFVREQSKEDVPHDLPADGSFKICSVGRLCDAKGFDLAVRACKELEKLGYDIKWYVVGFGGSEEYLKQLIKEYDVAERFILLGKKINPYPYIKHCDIYCQPSRYEGKAVTVTEAQILEKPVVITNYPTAHSQLQDGVDGIICELSVEGIVQGIERLLKSQELRERLTDYLQGKKYSHSRDLDTLYQLIDA